MNDQPDLIPVFIPQLAAMLIHAEDKKGAPLDPTEVLEIRDSARRGVVFSGSRTR